VIAEKGLLWCAYHSREQKLREHQGSSVRLDGQNLFDASTALNSKMKSSQSIVGNLQT